MLECNKPAPLKQCPLEIILRTIYNKCNCFGIRASRFVGRWGTTANAENNAIRYVRAVEQHLRGHNAHED